jgi:nicotinamide mononucleotide transporter
MHYLSISTVFFTVLGYPMSYIEFFGTVFNIWCVYLTAKGKVLSWPIGMAGIVLYFFLFYQIRLYSDLLEQVYFFVMSIYGWWLWTHPKTAEGNVPGELAVSGNTPRSLAWYGGVTVALSVMLGLVMTRIHVWLPTLFPDPASYPYLDALTTVMSFTATVLMAKKKVACWYLWILVDVIGIWLYYVKGVKFIALEYVLFLALAIQGYRSWKKQLQHQAIV